MEVVLDANVLVSGFTFGNSVPDQLLRYWQEGRYRLVVSAHVIEEVTRTLDKPYFKARLSESQRQRSLVLLQTEARSTEMTIAVSAVASHSEDDLVLATALSGEADFLVTGDRMLLRLGSYQSFTIRSPREFVTLLERLEQDDEVLL